MLMYIKISIRLLYLYLVHHMLHQIKATQFYSIFSIYKVEIKCKQLFFINLKSLKTELKALEIHEKSLIFLVLFV